MIDWDSRETHLLLTPRMPAGDRQRFELLAQATPIDAHVWMATSGSTGEQKLTALSKAALLASAAAVNRHLDARSSDTWCCVLPPFHVGGLGIHARARLAGARVVTIDWDARRFAASCNDERIAFSALVPAQVSDLVRAGLRAPTTMRAIVVGGGALAPKFFAEGRELGWPLLLSYGMTECCSQVATATYESPDLQILSHLEVRATVEGLLAFRGASILTGYAVFDRHGRPTFIDPKVDGWFVSEDLGHVDGRHLMVEGRQGELVKIGGESVDLKRLDRIIDDLLPDTGGDAAVIAVPDARLGHVIHLAVTREGIAEEFDRRVMPFERARIVHRIESIPRSPLGKLLRTQLAEGLLR